MPSPGINVILYYASDLFELMGFDKDSASKRMNIINALFNVFQRKAVHVPVALYTHTINSNTGCLNFFNQGNGAGLKSEPVSWMNHKQSVVLTLPPLAALVLQLK